MKESQAPTPRAGPGEAILRVDTVLTCGTDLKIYRRGHPLVRSPQILGHEFAGEIMETGTGMKRFQEGDRIVAVNSAPCKRCFYCKKGEPNLCTMLNERLLGFSEPGGYAEFVRIPKHILAVNAYPLPSNVPIEEMAMLEPLACAVHGNEESGMRKDDLVAIIGGGPIGLLHVALAKTAGAGRVICVDHHDSKLEIARNLGADVTVAARGAEAVETVKELTEGRGVDVAIEATGRPEAWSRAFDMVRKGGTAVFFGGCPTGTVIGLEAGKIHYGELTLKGSFHHTPQSVRKAYQFLSKHPGRLSSLISGRMPLSEAEKALLMMAKGEAMKIALKP